MPIPGMKRREFVAALGGAAAWPLVARAQQASKIYRIGIVSAGPVPPSKIQSAFFDGLRDLGWIEGKNIAFEQRYADNHLERLPDLAADLVHLHEDVIVAAGTLALLAAKRATASIPIVMTGAGDPLGSGLIASLARPSGNIHRAPPPTQSKKSTSPPSKSSSMILAYAALSSLSQTMRSCGSVGCLIRYLRSLPPGPGDRFVTT